MRPPVLSVVLMVLLAGCAGGGEDSDDVASISSPNTTEAASPTLTAEPIPTTDTLYFRKVPDMSVEAGTESTPETTPYSFGGGGFGGSPPRWEYLAQADASPQEVEATIWIRIVEPLVVPPAQPACVWSLNVYANDEFAFPTMCSGPNGPNVMPGDYELRFSTGSPNQTAVVARSTWAFVLGRTAFSPTPNEAVLVLTGSEDFPSNVRIGGLAEPTPAT